MDGKLVLDYGTRMILAAAILLFGIYSAGLSSQETFAQTQTGEQSAPSSASSGQSNPQGQGSTQPAAAPAQSNNSASQETAPVKASPAKKRPRKKKPAVAPCDASSSSGSAGSSSAANGSNPTQSAETSANPPAKDCPPQKIVVPQGGTAEPSIQLAGGDQASQKRDAANQMLGSTEANLKKIAGLQLSKDQKDTVAQIRQFVDQSKAALAAGDIERGRTLAWKAELLSDDLVQPQK